MPMPKPFVPWGADHRAVLALIALAILTLALNRRRLQGPNEQRWRRVAAAGLLANELGAWVVGAAQGIVVAPLQLCDLALLLTCWVLWSLRPMACELAYFWGLSGSLQALLTPDVVIGFPAFGWIQFFLSHGGIVVGVVYLALIGRVQPIHRSVWRVWGLTNLYAACAGLVNRLFGTNYGYLAWKPSQPSLLDYFGPWPWYILGMEMAALVLLYLCYAPFAGRRATPRVASSVR
jgi:hypothetical integral membrane protein (TIGR02206 family)